VWPFSKNKKVINIKVNVDRSQLDAALEKLKEFNQLLDDANTKMEQIDKRVGQAPQDTLEDTGIG
jgi:hypothetical protein